MTLNIGCMLVGAAGDFQRLASGNIPKEVTDLAAVLNALRMTILPSQLTDC